MPEQYFIFTSCNANANMRVGERKTEKKILVLVLVLALVSVVWQPGLIQSEYCHWVLTEHTNTSSYSGCFLANLLSQISSSQRKTLALMPLRTLIRDFPPCSTNKTGSANSHTKGIKLKKKLFFLLWYCGQMGRCSVLRPILPRNTFLQCQSTPWAKARIRIFLNQHLFFRIQKFLRPHVAYSNWICLFTLIRQYPDSL